MTLRIYAVLALLGILAAGGTTLYLKGRSDAAHKATITRLEKELQAERDAAAKAQAALLQDQILAEQDDKLRAEREARIEGLELYVDSLEDKLSTVFSAGDVDQLRKSAWGQH